VSSLDELIAWLNEEDGSLAHHDLFLVMHRVWERLQQRNADPAEITDAMQRLAPLDFLAHGKARHVWGSVFSPKREANVSENIVESPNLSEFNDSTVENWVRLGKELKRPELRARFSDAAWELSRKITGKRVSYRVGLRAAEAHLEAANETREGEFFDAVLAATRAIQLAHQLGAKEIFTKSFDLMIELADTADQSLMGRWFAPFDRLIHQKGLTAEQREAIVSALEKRFREAIVRKDLHQQKMAGQALALHFHGHRDYDRAKEITLSYGEATIALTDEQSAMLATHHLSSVMDDYLRMGLRGDSDRVRVLLEERAKGAHSEMREHSFEIKLDLGDVEASIAEKIDHKDPYFALWRLAWSCAPVPEDVVARFQAASEEFSFHRIMPLSIIGELGLPVSSIDTYDRDQQGRHVLEVKQEMSFNAGLFAYGIEEWKKKFALEDFHRVPGLFDCLLIPDARQVFFEQGFAAYAAGDYFKAIHILIPQIENSLRELLKLLGLPITKTDDEGGFEHKNMNDVLHDEIVREVLDERLWSFLKVLYTDKRGFNLRNVVMHGIAEPGEFNQTTAAMVLQSVMLLTMVREGGIFFEEIVDEPEDASPSQGDDNASEGTIADVDAEESKGQ
jgi:hypothetical protein